jgi:hypothetical protein
MSFWQAKTVIRPSDRLFSEFIRKRDGDCKYRAKCNGGWDYKELHCSHFYGRGRESVRFDPENADASCRACHHYVGDTEEGRKWLKEWKLAQLGQRAYDLLMLRANTPGKRDDVLAKMYCRQLLKELNGHTKEV